jgi:cytochrome c oxidase cbb3-type subunit IV
MDWMDIYVALRSLWVVWFMALFVFVVAWAFWPSRRKSLEEQARIPLRHDS